jgi:hypothetical protein
MKNDSIPSFKKFSTKLENKKVDEASNRASNKLIKATENYHDAQLTLQHLQNEFVKTTKEDPIEREELKQAIIAQNKIVKQKESIFNKALGEEDIHDFEI